MSVTKTDQAPAFQVEVDFSSADEVKASVAKIKQNFGAEAEIVFAKRNGKLFARSNSNRHAPIKLSNAFNGIYVKSPWASFDNKGAGEQLEKALGEWGEALAKKMNRGPFKKAIKVSEIMKAVEDKEKWDACPTVTTGEWLASLVDKQHEQAQISSHGGQSKSGDRMEGTIDGQKIKIIKNCNALETEIKVFEQKLDSHLELEQLERTDAWRIRRSIKFIRRSLTLAKERPGFTNLMNAKDNFEKVQEDLALSRARASLVANKVEKSTQDKLLKDWMFVETVNGLDESQKAEFVSQRAFDLRYSPRAIARRPYN